jgi:hypothetical protein
MRKHNDHVQLWEKFACLFVCYCCVKTFLAVLVAITNTSDLRIAFVNCATPVRIYDLDLYTLMWRISIKKCKGGRIRRGEGSSFYNPIPTSRIWLKAGVTGREGMLTPLSHLITHLVHPEVRVFHFHWPVRIQARIDPPYLLACRKRRLNGAVLWMRPEKPKSCVTA